MDIITSIEKKGYKNYNLLKNKKRTYLKMMRDKYFM